MEKQCFCIQQFHFSLQKKIIWSTSRKPRLWTITWISSKTRGQRFQLAKSKCSQWWWWSLQIKYFTLRFKHNDNAKIFLFNIIFDFNIHKNVNREIWNKTLKSIEVCIHFFLILCVAQKNDNGKSSNFMLYLLYKLGCMYINVFTILWDM